MHSPANIAWQACALWRHRVGTNLMADQTRSLAARHRRHPSAGALAAAVDAPGPAQPVGPFECKQPEVVVPDDSVRWPHVCDGRAISCRPRSLCERAQPSAVIAEAFKEEGASVRIVHRSHVAPAEEKETFVRDCAAERVNARTCAAPGTRDRPDWPAQLCALKHHAEVCSYRTLRAYSSTVACD